MYFQPVKRVPSEKWVTELDKQAQPDIVIALVGNKTDLQTQRQVSTEEVTRYAQQNYPNLILMEASAKTGDCVVELQITGSNRTAIETANLLRTVISNSRWSSAASLIQIIREIAVRIIKAQPIEFAVGNIIRRVLHLIREEYRTNVNTLNNFETVGIEPIIPIPSRFVIDEIGRSNSPMEDDLSFAAFKSGGVGPSSSGTSLNS
ncbi:Small GTPase, partial [Perkinsus sp. BL_2016]